MPLIEIEEITNPLRQGCAGLGLDHLPLAEQLLELLRPQVQVRRTRDPVGRYVGGPGGAVLIFLPYQLYTYHEVLLEELMHHILERGLGSIRPYWDAPRSSRLYRAVDSAVEKDVWMAMLAFLMPRDWLMERLDADIPLCRMAEELAIPVGWVEERIHQTL